MLDTKYMYTFVIKFGILNPLCLKVFTISAINIYDCSFNWLFKLFTFALCSLFFFLFFVFLWHRSCTKCFAWWKCNGMGVRIIRETWFWWKQWSLSRRSSTNSSAYSSSRYDTMKGRKTKLAKMWSYLFCCHY